MNHSHPAFSTEWTQHGKSTTSGVMHPIPLVGGFVGGILGLTLTLIGIWMCVRAKKNQLKPIKGSKKKRNNSGSTSTNTKSKRIPLNKLFSADIRMPTTDEFDELPVKPKSIQHFSTIKADLLKNQNLIRTKGVVPYDQNIVQLKHSENNVDFVNASWVNIVQTSDGLYDLPVLHPYLPSSMIGLISAQSPMENTVDQHVQMLYEAKVGLVVELSQNASMNGGEKFDGAIVSKKMIDKMDLNDMLTREVWDLSKERGKTRRLVFLQLKDWANSGELSEVTIQNMLTTITQARKDIGNTRETMTLLVQDEQGGVGGAAVFIALIQLLEKIDDAVIAAKSHVGKFEEDDFTINVFETIQDLRCKRMGMIQSLEEYTFLHQALLHYVKNKEQYDDLLKQRQDYLSSDDPAPTRPEQQTQNEIEDEYVLHNPENEEPHEYLDEHKVYDNDGGVYVNDNMYLE